MYLNYGMNSNCGNIKAKVLLVFFLISISSLTYSEGLLKGLLGGAIGGSMVSKGRDRESYIYIANNHLWGMHKQGKYTKNYKTYLTYLENHGEHFYDFHVVAIAYFDNGDYQKALDIYEAKVMPWAMRRKGEYLSTYNIIKKKACSKCPLRTFDDPIRVKNTENMDSSKVEKVKEVFIDIGDRVKNKVSEISEKKKNKKNSGANLLDIGKKIVQ